MSLDAMRWAFNCPVQTSAERLVLLALANECRRGEGLAFPSRERMHAVTRLDAKTIAGAIKGLTEAKLIQDTGERRGRTGRIRVYRLAIAAPRNEAKNGFIHRGAMAPLFPPNEGNPVAFNDTKNGVQNQEVKPEPGREPGKLGELPDWIPLPAWQRYVEMRQRIGEPISTPLKRRRAVESLRQLGEAGHDAQAVLEQSIARGWIGLFEVRGSTARKAPDRSLGAIDYEAGLPAKAAA